MSQVLQPETLPGVFNSVNKDLAVSQEFFFVFLRAGCVDALNPDALDRSSRNEVPRFRAAFAHPAGVFEPMRTTMSEPFPMPG